MKCGAKNRLGLPCKKVFKFDIYSITNFKYDSCSFLKSGAICHLVD